MSRAISSEAVEECTLCKASFGVTWGKRRSGSENRENETRKRENGFATFSVAMSIFHPSGASYSFGFYYLSQRAPFIVTIILVLPLTVWVEVAGKCVYFPSVIQSN